MPGLVLSKPDKLVTDQDDELRAAEGFGIHAGTTAYFDPDGAVGGEAAWIRLDPTGIVLLESDFPAETFGLVEGARRPVELPAPVSLPIRLKPGATFHPPTSRPPSMLGGRPVPLAEPHTASLRTGRPVPLAAPVTLTTTPRKRPRVETPRGCSRCGAPGPKRGLCAVCREQADIRKVVRLSRRDKTREQISEETSMSTPHVRYLLAKAKRRQRLAA